MCLQDGKPNMGLLFCIVLIIDVVVLALDRMAEGAVDTGDIVYGTTVHG
jgi:lipopolysaccharide export LptBFGC system permease protein LptF